MLRSQSRDSESLEKSESDILQLQLAQLQLVTLCQWWANCG